ncbi:hypothetical protein [Streptomyces sp. IBSBF 2435]|uniref:hypothetical protein n=1 Tax=Streptomyces sp. IBSBF 2435 TaxID=2903531 RepID=UPI002FDC5B89
MGSADALLGTMCVHIHNLATDQYYWFGPWTECRKVSIEWYDVVTYVKSNQTGGVQSTYYDPQGVSLGSKPAYYNGRPPGYKSNDESKTAAIQVCPA